MLVPRPPRPLSRSRRAARGVLILAATLAFHGAVVGLVVLSSLVKWAVPERPRGPAAPSRPVSVRALTPQQFERNRGPAARQPDEQRTAQREPRPRKKEEKRPEEMPKGQIVDVAPGNNEVDPNARYIAETNNAVKKETRAKEQSAFYRNAMPERTAPQRVEGNGTAEKAQVSGNNGQGDDDRPIRDEARSKQQALLIPDTKKREQVNLKTSTPEGPGVAVSNRDESLEVKGNSSRLNLSPGAQLNGEEASAGRIGQAGVLNLLPSAAVVDKIIGAAPNDHLRDVDVGDGTYLSTREWKYASFFNRVKQSVGQEWNPTSQLRLRDPTGQIYGGRDRYTILTVTLDDAGRLKDAFVDKSSGLDFLDLEAIKAFERAQPFPNPPPGIVANDSTIRFQFGFFLELSGRPGMRLFRSTE
jgi:TonB family protein